MGHAKWDGGAITARFARFTLRGVEGSRRANPDPGHPGGVPGALGAY